MQANLEADCIHVLHKKEKEGKGKCPGNSEHNLLVLLIETCMLSCVSHTPHNSIGKVMSPFRVETY